MFLGLYIFLVEVILFGSLYDRPPDSLTPLFGISYKVYCLWVIVLITNQFNSGLLAKQLSNGQSRKNLFIELVFLILITSSFFYILSVVLFGGLVFFNEQYIPDFKEIIGLPFLGFISLGFYALLIGLFIKRPAVAVVVGYLLVDLDRLPASLLSKSISPDLGLIFPYYASASFVNIDVVQLYDGGHNPGMQLLAILLFTFLFSRFVYNRTMKMDFN